MPCAICRDLKTPLKSVGLRQQITPKATADRVRGRKVGSVLLNIVLPRKKRKCSTPSYLIPVKQEPKVPLSVSSR